MKEATKKAVEAFARGAFADNPAERDAVISALKERPAKRDKMLTAREACALAGVHRVTLRDWERKGYIHPNHITRRRVRFSRNELEAFLCEAAEA